MKTVIVEQIYIYIYIYGKGVIQFKHQIQGKKSSKKSSYISTAIDRTYVPWWLVHGMFFACLMLEPLAPLILEPTIEDLSKKFPVGPYGTQLQINLLDWDLRHSLLHLGHQVMKQETPIIHDWDLRLRVIFFYKIYIRIIESIYLTNVCVDIYIYIG